MYSSVCFKLKVETHILSSRRQSQVVQAPGPRHPGPWLVSLLRPQSPFASRHERTCSRPPLACRHTHSVTSVFSNNQLLTLLSNAPYLLGVITRKPLSHV